MSQFKAAQHEKINKLHIVFESKNISGYLVLLLFKPLFLQIIK